MVNNTSTKNVKLSREQLEQLDEYNSRIANLESEFKLISKNIAVAKDDADKAIADRKYRESILNEFDSKIVKAKTEYEELEANITDAKKELADTVKKTKVIAADNLTRHEDLSKREQQVTEREEALNTKEIEYHKKLTELSNEQLSIKKAKDAFEKAIESLVWK